MADRALTNWAVSDGRAGIENQVLGLAEAVARLRPAVIVPKRVGYRGLVGRLPSALNLAPRRWLSVDADPIGPPWPDLWIAAGRASLPLSLRVRRWSKGKTFVVQAQDPRYPPRLFDLVIAPRHDEVHGENVVSIVGAPNRVTPERLASEFEAFRERIEALPGPRAAVLIGGRSRRYDLSPRRAEDLADGLEAALDAAGASLLLTFSRRTPEPAKAILAQRLKPRGWIWDGTGANPYFAFLATADYVAVTEDSTNLATEAAAAGKPVLILGMDGRSERMARFHHDLEAAGAARPFEGRFETWTYPPLRETDRAAAEVVRRLRAWRGS
jgi:mitochondrial fission protein ELM1